eukprot:9338084-Karenia_brevis.AAC.1
MSAEVHWLACYVMLSRARSLAGLLILRLATRSELSAGAPSYLIDAVERLLQLERDSTGKVRDHLMKFTHILPPEILQLFDEASADEQQAIYDQLSSNEVGAKPGGTATVDVGSPLPSSDGGCRRAVPPLAPPAVVSLHDADSVDCALSTSLISQANMHGSNGVRDSKVDDGSSMPSVVCDESTVSTSATSCGELTATENVLRSANPAFSYSPGQSPASDSRGQPTDISVLDVASELGYVAGDDAQEDNVTASLRNAGNTCYLNALLHVFGRVPALRRWFRQHAAIWGEAHAALNCPLCLIAADINKLCIDVGLTAFTPSIVRTRAIWSNGAYNNFEQHDVAEAARFLLDSLNSVDERAMNARDPWFEGRSLDDVNRFTTPMWKLMKFSFINQIHCTTCGFTSGKEEQLCTLPLELPDQPQQIEVLLANQWGEQLLKPGESPYQCPNDTPCGPGARVQRIVLPKHWPKVLILSLKRFAWQGGDIRKICTQVDFETLLLVPDGQAPYHLRGVIEHHGREARGGHYTAC